MPIVLESQIEPPFSVDVRNASLRPGMNPDEISSQVIPVGRREMRLGDLFRINLKSPDETALSHSDPSQTVSNDPYDFIWSGLLTTVHGIGFGLASGSIKVLSDCGRHLGSQMTGGTIEVKGNASHYVGTSMSGGQIRITGNAGDFVGGGFAGEKRGMRGGEVLIEGDAGDGTGRRMRRGLIFVNGSCGDFAAESMLAGTIVVMNEAGQLVGRGMKRGTILLPNQTACESQHHLRFSDKASPYVGRLIGQHLTNCGVESARQLLDDSPLTHFAGDVLYGGRGEVFFKCD